MKEIRSVKEQYQIKDACLKERLELILPKVMKKYDVDMLLNFQNPHCQLSQA